MVQISFVVLKSKIESNNTEEFLDVAEHGGTVFETESYKCYNCNVEFLQFELEMHVLICGSAIPEDVKDDDIIPTPEIINSMEQNEMKNIDTTAQSNVNNQSDVTPIQLESDRNSKFQCDSSGTFTRHF